MHKKKKHDEETWDNRKLGAEEAFVRKVSSEREKILDEKLGLQAISIRLQKNLIEDLKELAGEEGLLYQPYVRQILTRYVRDEKRKRGKYLRAMDR